MVGSAKHTIVISQNQMSNGDQNTLLDTNLKDNPLSETLPAVDKKTLILIRNLLEDIQSKIGQVIQLIEDNGQPQKISPPEVNLSSDQEKFSSLENQNNFSRPERIIEGVFDGQGMKGYDGKEYTVPANYASKSKLVEGDILKLTVTKDGSFIYKQIKPIERKRLTGILTKDEESGEFLAVQGAKKYKVLTASVTYFKGGVGDEVVILVPSGFWGHYAAVENIIKKDHFSHQKVSEGNSPEEKAASEDAFENQEDSLGQGFLEDDLEIEQ